MTRSGTYKKFLFLCACTMALSAGASFAQENVVSQNLETSAVITEESQRAMRFQPVLLHAYRHNPSLMAARSEFRATQELLPQAHAGFKPTIGSGLNINKSDIAGSNFPGADGSTSKDVSLSLDQPLFRGGRTFAQSAAAQYTIQAQHAVLQSAEQDILLAAVTSYVDVLRDQALFNLGSNNRDVIAKQLEATQDRFDVGELTITDVSQAKARLARADSDVISAKGDLDSSYAIFEEVVGFPPTILEEVGFQAELPKNLEEAIALAEEGNPRILSALYAHKSAENDVDNVFGELLPEIGFFASWNRTFDPQPGLSDRQTTKSVGLSASFPLYQAGAVRSRMRQAKHSANSRYMDIRDAKRQIRQETITAWSSWKAAKSEIRSRDAQVEASEIAQEGVKAEAELGSRTILDTLDADQEFLDAQVALVTARRNEVVAKFTLLSTLGLLSPQTLGFAADQTDYSVAIDEKEREILNEGVDRLPPVE